MPVPGAPLAAHSGMPPAAAAGSHAHRPSGSSRAPARTFSAGAGAPRGAGEATPRLALCAAAAAPRRDSDSDRSRSTGAFYQRRGRGSCGRGPAAPAAAESAWSAAAAVSPSEAAPTALDGADADAPAASRTCIVALAPGEPIAVAPARGLELGATAAPLTPPAMVPPMPGLPPASDLGMAFQQDGTVSFRLWAPHAREAWLEVVPSAAAFDPPVVPRDRDHPSITDPGVPVLTLPLTRGPDDTWAGRFPPGALPVGAQYRVRLTGPDGAQYERRDIYARQTDYDSNWCMVIRPSDYAWKARDWVPRPHDEAIIYELHIGSFTPEGTFRAAAERLAHVAALGFTAVQLMPVAEHSDAWGYNPRLFFAPHGPYGTANELRALVDEAHRLGMGVIFDIVLHHGAPDGNSMWNYDAIGWNNDGGIYHEGGHDGPWGRSLAMWKGEVVRMLGDAAAMYLLEYRGDGLRFDSGNDIPREVLQALTCRLREAFPGRILTAEVTPENPSSIHDLGFDSVWLHSGYFDIIHQHRALGCGHHGGGDWADGWNIPRLRTAFCLHYGFTGPSQVIKYFTGSHDQVGDQHGGKNYDDYAMIGGRHRYAVDQFGGGRSDPHARASQRQWYAANVGSAGLPMMFQGTEWGQGGWWHTTNERRVQWAQAEDETGRQMMAAVAAANQLRAELPALRRGWPNMLHEDRPNGVLAFERVHEGDARVVVVVNAGRGRWTDSNYGLFVGGGRFEEIYHSHEPRFGGFAEAARNEGRQITAGDDGKIWINVFAQTCLILKQVG